MNSVKELKVPVSVSRSMSGGTMGMVSWGWAAAATSPRRAGSRPCRAFVCNGYVCAAPPHSLQEPLQESYRQHMLPLEEIVRLVQSGIRIKTMCPKTTSANRGETVTLWSSVGILPLTSVRSGFYLKRTRPLEMFVVFCSFFLFL